jgi:hypothetical protein
MSLSHRLIPAAITAAILIGTWTPSPAAATFTQEIDPTEANVGDQVVVTITVQNGTMNRVQLPVVDGLPVTGTRTQLQSMDDNGVSSTALSFNFALTPQRETSPFPPSICAPRRATSFTSRR